MRTKYNYSYSPNKLIAIAEQGIISSLNFGSILLLSSILSAEVFTKFIVIFSIASFVFIISSCFIATPLMIFLPKHWIGKEKLYLFNILIINFALSSLLLLISILIYSFFKDIFFDLNVIIFISLWSSYEALRKFYYTINISRKRLLFSSLSLFFVFFTFLFFKYFFYEEITLVTVFAAYSISYAIAFFLAFTPFYSIKHRFTKIDFNIIITLLNSHYNFSKWLVLGSFAFWIYTQGYYLIAVEFLLDKQISKVRTIQNILGIFSVLALVIENIFTIDASNYFLKFKEKGLVIFVNNFFQKAKKYLLIIFFLMLIFAFIIYNYFYESKYGESKGLILIFAISQLLLLALKPLVLVLRVKEFTLPFTVSHVLAALAVSTLGVLSIIQFSALGMALGFLMSSLVFCLTLYLYYRKNILNKQTNK